MNTCVYSSFVFLLNTFLSYIYKDYVYSILFLILWLTSYHYHTKYTPYTKQCDQLAIFAILTYGGYVLLNKCSMEKKLMTFLVLLTLFTSIYLYKNQCQDPDEQKANKYHSLMHFISSLGHSLIVAM